MSGTNKTRWATIGVVTAALATAGAAALAQNRPDSDRARQAPPPPPKPPSYNERYAGLEEKNIFLKTRQARRPTGGSGGSADAESRPAGPTEASRRRVEDSFVLTGIALLEGRHVAFIENTSNYTTVRLTPGEAVASGKIVNVEADFLEYEAAGQRTRVDVGRNLAGGLAQVAAPPAPIMTVSGVSVSASGIATTQPTTGPSGTPPAPGAPAVAGAPAPSGPPADPNNPNISIEERMRLRRMQEQQRR